MKNAWWILAGGIVIAAIVLGSYMLATNIPDMAYGRMITDVTDLSDTPRGEACNPDVVYEIGDGCLVAASDMFTVYVLLKPNGEATLMAQNPGGSRVTLDHKKMEVGLFALQHTGITGSTVVVARRENEGYKLAASTFGQYEPYAGMCLSQRLVSDTDEALVWQGVDSAYAIKFRSHGYYYDLKLDGKYGSTRLSDNTIPSVGETSHMYGTQHVMDVTNCGGGVLALAYDFKGPFGFPGIFH